MDWKDEMRDLWLERTSWIQQFIISLVTGTRNLGFVSTKAILSGTKIANIFSRFYGAEIASQVEFFLTQQILLLAELASTTKSGRDIAPLKASWDANAEGLIEVLLRINPFWDESTWREILEEQFRLQYDFLARLSIDQYEQGIANFDLAQNNARKTANVIINGIEQQFHA